MLVVKILLKAPIGFPNIAFEVNIKAKCLGAHGVHLKVQVNPIGKVSTFLKAQPSSYSLFDMEEQAILCRFKAEALMLNVFKGA